MVFVVFRLDSARADALSDIQEVCQQKHVDGTPRSFDSYSQPLETGTENMKSDTCIARSVSRSSIPIGVGRLDVHYRSKRPECTAEISRTNETTCRATGSIAGLARTKREGGGQRGRRGEVRRPKIWMIFFDFLIFDFLQFWELLKKVDQTR